MKMNREIIVIPSDAPFFQKRAKITDLVCYTKEEQEKHGYPSDDRMIQIAINRLETKDECNN